MRSFFVFLLAAGVARAGVLIDSRVPYLFEGTVMANESVAFMGTVDAASLMYQADEILSVWSSDLKTEFVRDVDWTFDATTHRIKPTTATRIPYYTEAEYYPESGTVGGNVFDCNVPGRKYVLFGEGTTMHRKQVWVTYRHADAWSGPNPRNEAAAFAPLLDELQGYTGGNILFFGDSITAGGNSSGEVGFEPFVPGWPRQVFAAITNFTGNLRLKYVNTAVGGMTSHWGVSTVQENVVAYAPKFVAIAFGMNDGDATANYTNRIATIVRAVHAGCPDASVLLVSPMVPNAEATIFASKAALFPQYETALAGLVDDFHAQGFARIGLANVTTMHRAVLEKKRFRDMTGNNVNHCNDFSARIYRDTILAALGLSGPDAPCPKPHTLTPWFDGGIAAGWPTASSCFGGVWRNAEVGFLRDGALWVTNATEDLSFDADSRVSFSGDSVVIGLRAQMFALDELPPVPEGSATSIVAVDEFRTISYFVLVKASDGRKDWRRLPGAVVRPDGVSDVRIALRRDHGHLMAVFAIDDYMSRPYEIGEAPDVGTVSFSGFGSVNGLLAERGFASHGVILVVE
ncbi:MAG: SGNH/GDSL hydrolase family protein [bacterium]|nr:SGNH/GDSL hydrolase family protein [Candidatus Colisoma equi]